MPIAVRLSSAVLLASGDPTGTIDVEPSALTTITPASAPGGANPCSAPRSPNGMGPVPPPPKPPGPVFPNPGPVPDCGPVDWLVSNCTLERLIPNKSESG